MAGSQSPLAAFRADGLFGSEFDVMLRVVASHPSAACGWECRAGKAWLMAVRLVGT